MHLLMQAVKPESSRREQNQEAGRPGGLGAGAARANERGAGALKNMTAGGMRPGGGAPKNQRQALRARQASKRDGPHAEGSPDRVLCQPAGAGKPGDPGLGPGWLQEVGGGALQACCTHSVQVHQAQVGGHQAQLVDEAHARGVLGHQADLGGGRAREASGVRSGAGGTCGRQSTGSDGRGWCRQR